MKDLSIPKPERRDHVYKVIAKGGISAFPIIGGMLAEIIDFIPTELKAREEQFIKDIVERLNHLTSQNLLTVDDLKRNKLFQTVLVKSLRIVIENHQNEKLRC